MSVLGLASFDVAIRGFGKRLETASKDVVTDRAARAFRPQLQKQTPVRKVAGGTLRDSIEHTRGADGTQIVGTSLKYGAIVLPGRRQAKKSGRWVGSKQSGKGDVVKKARRNFRRKLDALVKQEVGGLFR